MYGGVKRREHRDGKPKEGIVSIRDMLNARGSTIEMLTCGSLKGFMFVLNVQDAHSEFLTFNSSFRFTVPVTSFIVKLAVTSQAEEGIDDYVPLGETESEGIGKATETESSFFEEAKLQQHIWKSSVVGGREPICPPVANLSFFDNQNGINFLKFLNYKVREEASVHTLRFLMRVCSESASSGKNYGIGMIVMPKILQSDTFSSFANLAHGQHFQGIEVTQNLVERVYGSVVSKIVRLFIEVGVVHFDLHQKNALIYRRGASHHLHAVLIDFGRASSTTSGTDDEYLNSAEKSSITGEKHYGVAATRTGSKVAVSQSLSTSSLYEEALQYCASHSSTTSDQKYQFIHKIMKKIQELDYIKNQAMFRGSDYLPDRYQSNWLEALLPISQNVTRLRLADASTLLKKVSVYAFDNMCDEIITDPSKPKVTADTLNRVCLNFDHTATAQTFRTEFLISWSEFGWSLGSVALRSISHSLRNLGKRFKRKNTQAGQGKTKNGKGKRRTNKSMKNVKSRINKLENRKKIKY